MNIPALDAPIFGAPLFTGIFSCTRVPEVHLLAVIGIILGPVFHPASHYLIRLPMRLGLMLGAIVASTSPAVIVPLNFLIERTALAHFYTFLFLY